VFPTKFKFLGVPALALVVIGAGLLARSALAQRVPERDGPPRGEPARADLHGVLRSVDAAKHTLTMSIGAGRGEDPMEKTFAIAEKVEVLVDTGRNQRFFGREGKLADLAEGALVTLRLSDDKKTVEIILAEGPTISGKVTRVDAAKDTVSVAGGRGRGDDVEDKTYVVNPGAELIIDDGRGRRTSLHEAKLTDLFPGALVSMKLSVNQKEVISLTAEGPAVHGVLQAVDAGKGTVTLSTPPTERGGEPEKTTYAVGAHAEILMDDERPRRFYPMREAKLAELPVGAMTYLKLSPDQKSVVVIRAEGPTVIGNLKAADAQKGVLTIIVGRGRGSDGEDKTYTVAKDLRVLINGAEGKLADLKVGDNEPPIIVKLSVDQKVARTITVGGNGRR